MRHMAAKIYLPQIPSVSLLRFKGLRSLPHSTFLLFIFLDTFTTTKATLFAASNRTEKTANLLRSREKIHCLARDFYQTLLLSFVCEQIRGSTAVYQAADWSIVGHGANQQQKSPAGIFIPQCTLNRVGMFVYTFEEINPCVKV